MREIIGPTLEADLQAMSSLDLSNGDYSLSRDDFDLKDKPQEPQEKNPSSPRSPLSDDALQELQKRIDRITDMRIRPRFAKEAYLIFGCAHSHRRRPGDGGDDDDDSPFKQLLRRYPYWAPKRTSIQPMVNIMRRTGSVEEMQRLFNALPHQLSTKNRPEDLSGALDLCVVGLQAPSQKLRESARSYLSSLLSSDLSLELTSSVQLAALLANYCRAAHGWADDPLAAKMAHEVEDRMSTAPLGEAASHGQEAGRHHQMLLYSIAVQRSMSSASATRGRWSSASALTRWIDRIRYRGFLADASSSYLVHSIILRAHGREMALCETADEAMLLMQRITDDCNQLAAGRSSWSWAIRGLLDMETSLVRPIDADDTLRRPTSDLLKIDEANHLFNSFQPRLPSSIATPFLVYPLLQALLACFPPKIDLCMSIYRHMRPASQDSHLNFLRHLSIFGKDSVRPPAAEGPDRETLVLLLGWLSKHDFYRDRSKDHLVAIVEDLVKDRREWVLSSTDRMRYAFAYLCRYRDAEDGLEAWKQLSTQSDWCQDWTSETWKGLIWRLAGLAHQGQGKSVRETRGRRASLVKSTANYPAVPLAVFMRVMVDMAQRNFSPGIQLYTQLLKHLGQLASATNLAVSNGSPSTNIFASPAEVRSFLQDVYRTVHGIHSLLLFDSTLAHDLATLNALMDAYSRCERPDIVWEVWDRLALAALSSSGLRKTTMKRREIVIDPELEALSPSSNADDQLTAAVYSHGSLDAVSLSILLDTTGRHHSGSAAVRRAWRFAGKLDERTLITLSSSPRIKDSSVEYVSLIRNQNAWNSWLEFLCRIRRLEEAVEQLDVMVQEGRARDQTSLSSAEAATRVANEEPISFTAESIPRPDAKTLSTLLRFAAQRRDQEAARRMVMAETQRHSSQSSIWHQLRNRIKRGEFGQIWHQVKDIGIDTDSGW